MAWERPGGDPYAIRPYVKSLLYPLSARGMERGRVDRETRLYFDPVQLHP